MTEEKELKIVINGDSSGGESALQRIGEIASGMGLANLITGATTAMINFGKQAIMTGIDTASFYENAKIGLTTLLGDQKKAVETLAQIKKDALATPFDASQLVKANQLLISAGVSAKDSRQAILDLGNAVLATGGGNDELMRLGINLQQIKATGQATALDIKQFGYAGINIYKLLEQSTGKNIEALKNQKITYEDLTKALSVAAKDGGLFANAIQNAGASYTQTLSNMKESITNMMSEIVTKSGLFEGVKNTMLGLTNTMNTLTPLFIGLMNGSMSLSTVMATLKSQFPQLSEAIDGVYKFFVLLRNELTTILTPAIKQLEDLWNNHRATIIELGKSLLIVLGAAILIIVGLIAGLALAVVTIVNLWIRWQEAIQKSALATRAAIQEKIKAAQDLWKSIENAVTNIVNALKKVPDEVSKSIGSAIKSISDWFKRLPGEASTAFNSLSKSAEKGIDTANKALTKAAQKMATDFVNAIKHQIDVTYKFYTHDLPYAVGYGVGFLIKNVPLAINAIKKFIVDLATSIANEIPKIISNWVAGMTYAFTVMVSSVKNFIARLTNFLVTARLALIMFMLDMAAFFESLPGKIFNAMVKIGTAIFNEVSTWPARLNNFLLMVLNVALMILGMIFNAFVTWITQTWSWISGEVSQWPARTGAALSPIPGVVGGVLQKVIATIGDKLKQAWETANSWWNKIAEIFNNIINKANEALNAAKNAFSQGLHMGSRATGGFASGMTLVGEHGPEIVNLPAGSYVNNAPMSRGIGGAPSYSVVINNPSVRSDADIQQIVSQVTRALGRQNELVRLGVR